MMTTFSPEFLSEGTIRAPGRTVEFTRHAGFNMQQLIRRKDFFENDSELIFEYLGSQIRSVSFGDYLKRYIYRVAGMQKPFSSVEDSEFRGIIVQMFRETHTPIAFHKVSVKMSSQAQRWISSDYVARETVFLLGFGLNMPVDDVSMFLTKGIRECDFDFNEPEEVIYWYCLANRLGAGKANEMKQRYTNEILSGQPESGMEDRRFGKYSLFCLRTEEEVMQYLKEQYAANSGLSHPASVRIFSELLDSAKEEVRKCYEAEAESYGRMYKGSVTEADVEKMLYNGIPFDKKGNLSKASVSKLGRKISQNRLTRQRMYRLVEGSALPTRFDLITLLFFVEAIRYENTIDPEPGFYRSFIKKADKMLESCSMSELNITNPYEAFLLLCCLTDWPMAAFSDVWEKAYE